jgi:branched-chain amino acid aminotransferase
MAAIYAKENKLNDCLVLNVHDRVCDASIANIFWIKNDMVYTPPLSEGCVAGVIRKCLMEGLQGTRLKVQERVCEINDLENADEVFLTNAIQGIRWVKQFRIKGYTNRMVKEIYSLLLQSISI